MPMSLLAYTGISGDVVMEPGSLDLSVGSSSDDIRSTATLTVTGQTRVISGTRRRTLINLRWVMLNKHGAWDSSISGVL